MSIIKNNPEFKGRDLQKIFNYLLERELVLKMENDLIALKEIKKLLVYLVTNFSLERISSGYTTPN